MEPSPEDTRLIFLGTGASEAIPAAFCRCPHCQKARRDGGHDRRTRSAFRIDSRHQIDFGPDSAAQMASLGLDAFGLEHVLITHTHDDHFDVAELLARDCAFPASTAPLHIYLCSDGLDWARNLFRSYTGALSVQEEKKFFDIYRLVPVAYFQTFTAGALKATAIQANHRGFGAREWGLNYLVELPDGRSLLYATDTGWYGEQTWEFLSGCKADIVILEATFGGDTQRDPHPKGHLDVRSALLTLERMEAIGFVSDDTRLYATHINHKHGLMHADMQAAFDHSRFPVTVAYDGLTIL